MREAFQLTVNNVPFSNGPVECGLVHAKTIQLRTCFPAAVLPSPLVHVSECELIGHTQKRSPLPNLKDFGLCAEIVGISTLHDTTPSIFTLLNDLQLRDSTLYGLLWTLACNCISTVVAAATNTINRQVPRRCE